MKQIASFSKVEEAEMVRAFLDGAGVAASLRDDHTVAADWTLSNAIGGVKVDVAEEDAERAVALLREFAPFSPVDATANSKSHHTMGRYAKIAAVLFVLILVLIGTTTGFNSDVPTLVISAGGIALGIAVFLALFDL